MKQVILKSLKLTNFQGCTDFFEFSRESFVYGDNATGKTRLMTAYMWLLFGKDFEGKTDFDIKNINKDSIVQHHLTHAVEGVFEIDGIKVVLGRHYKEKWVTRQGEEVAECTSHETTFEIDGTPKKKKQYTEYINSIISEDLFKLISDPMYFLGLEKNKRVDLLSKIEVDYSSVSASPLIAEMLERKSIDDIKSLAMASRKELKAQQDEVQPRIDELTNSIIKPPMTQKDLNAQKKQCNTEISKLEKDLSQLSVDSELPKMEAEKASIEAEISKKQSKWQILQDGKIRSEQARLNANNLNIEGKQRKLEKLSKEADANKEEISEIEERNEKLRSDFRELQTQKFEVDPDLQNACPTCGRDYDQNFLAERLEKMKENFNKAVADGKENIQQLGIANNKLIEGLKKEVAIAENKVEDLKGLVGMMQKDSETHENNIKFLNSEKFIEPLELTEKLSAIDKKIKEFDNSSIDNKKVEINEKLEQIKLQLKDVELQLLQHENNKKSKARIKELNEEFIDLGSKIADQDRIIIDCDKYERDKSQVLQDSINQHFEFVQFKMFEEQMNGGVRSVCIPTVKGVGRSINNAWRYLAGIDICNFFSKGAQIELPMFFDNRESTTELTVKPLGQIINLVVSAEDKELRIVNN